MVPSLGEVTPDDRAAHSVATKVLYGARTFVKVIEEVYARWPSDSGCTLARVPRLVKCVNALRTMVWVHNERPITVLVFHPPIDSA